MRFDRWFVLPFLLTLVICLAVADLGLERIKDWQTLITGLLALAGAGWTVLHLQKQIEQNKEAADRQHRNAVRAANAHVLRTLDELRQNLRGMTTRAEQGQRPMLTRNSDYRRELMMDDTALSRLDVIITFQRQRDAARAELLRWHGTKRALEPVQRLSAVVDDIYRRLDEGQEIAEIAREIDGT